MATYVYNVADGSLYSYSPTDDGPVASDEELAADGRAVVRGLPPTDETHVWDAATLSVIEVPAPVYPLNMPMIEWGFRLTPDELQGLRASTDARIRQLIFILGNIREVDIHNADLIAAFDYAVSLGLLTEERKTAILADPV